MHVEKYVLIHNYYLNPNPQSEQESANPLLYISILYSFKAKSKPKISWRKPSREM